MIIFSIVFSIFFWIILYYHNKKNGVGLFSSFILGYYIYYIVIPAIIEILCLFSSESHLFFTSFLRKGGLSNIIYYIQITSFFIILLVSYMTIKPNVIFIINRSQFLKFIKIIGFVSLFCGGAALILYFHYLGGLIVALSMAEYARSLAYDMGDILSPSQVRLIVIARLIILSAFCYIILYKFNKTKFNKVCIIISIVITYIFLLFNASRTIIGIYSVALIFPILSKYCRHPWQIIFVISIVGLNGLNLLDSLFSSFSSNSEFNVAEFKYNEIIMQFSFAYRNVLHSFNIMNEFGCRYFLDLITSFLNFIPGVTFQSSIEPTSIYFGGPYWRKMGGIPNDVVTYSILEGGIIGVILFPIFIGRILKRADNSLSSLIGSDKKSNIAKIVKPYLMMSVFFCVPSADLQSIIGNYTVFIFSFALCYFSKRKQLQNS